MKKLFTILFFVLFFSTILMSPIKSSANSITYAVPLRDGVTIYENRTGEYIPIGTMKMSQPLIVNAQRNEWWRINFGTSYAYIHKDDVTLTKKSTIRNINTKFKNSNKTVITNRDTEVYDNTSGKLVSMATIKEGYRYPVISESGNFWMISLGGRVGYIAKVRAMVDNGIPILMYHHILKPEEKVKSQFANASTTVTTTEFDEQMDWLAEHGFIAITLQDLENYMDGKVNLPGRAVVITFDDGIVSTREYAYPTLKNYGFVAEQFIITGRMPTKPANFDWKELQFLSQQDMDQLADVFKYGSHTHDLHRMENGKSHVVLLEDNIVNTDIKTSKEILGSSYFAYPFGQYNAKTIQTLRQLKFTMALTMKQGKVKLGVDRMQLPRVGIEPGLSIDEFAKKVRN